MRGRGIGTARGRATIMRGMCSYLVLYSFIDSPTANGSLSVFRCLLSNANSIFFTSASWTRRTRWTRWWWRRRISTSWYSTMILLFMSIQPLSGERRKGLRDGQKLVRAQRACSSYVTISKDFNAKIQSAGPVRCVRSMWSTSLFHVL